MKILLLPFIAVFLIGSCSGKNPESGTDPEQNRTNESMEKIGESTRVSYVFYTANNGDLYYVNTSEYNEADGSGNLDLMKYQLATGKTITVKDNFTSSVNDNNEGFGMIAPTEDGDIVYCMTTSGEVWKLTCSKDSFQYIMNISSEYGCGTNWWKRFNLTLAGDENSLFFVSTNNQYDNKHLYKIDLLADSPVCREVLDISTVVAPHLEPERDLCFGGINVWDNDNNFYVPVWSFSHSDDDLAILKVHVPRNAEGYSAELIHFTDTGEEDGTRLLPGFRHNSCWSGISAASNGSIYIAVSNHYQPSAPDDIHGNVAVFKYNPSGSNMEFLGDLKSVSSAVNNWMPDESQHKVHTFLMELDGKIYFATDDYEPSYFLRGSHLYAIDLSNDTINDYSKTQGLVMLNDFSVIKNRTEPTSRSGIFIQYYGIKGISANRHVPGLIYAMLYGLNEPGHIIKYRMP